MRSRQLSFLPPPRRDHGGEIRKGKRKLARPFDPKKPIHVVMRSSRARRDLSMLRPAHARRIQFLVRISSSKWNLRLHQFANVGNHLHLLVSARKRSDLQAFLREFAGRVAFEITGAKKASPQGRFWDHLAYSRIVSPGREFKAVYRYLVQNLFEAQGAREKPALRLFSVPFS